MTRTHSIIKEVTNQNAAHSLKYNDHNTFLGINELDVRISSVDPDQVLIARHYLQDQPSGSKFHCYEYGEALEYFIRGKQEERISIFFSHTYFLNGKRLCAISNHDNKTLLYFDRKHSNNLDDIYEQEMNGIPADERNHADTFFKQLQQNNQLKSDTKLQHRKKQNRIFTITDYDENGTSQSRTVILKHTFYRIEDKLYALAGNGHKISGSFGKVKIGCEYNLCQTELPDAPELVVLKIPKKKALRSQELIFPILQEYALYKATGLLKGTATKLSGVPSGLNQEICVMHFFHMDLLENINRGHLRTMMKQLVAASLEHSVIVYPQLIFFTADFFLKLVNQLEENITRHHFLHRDIKPENIVLTTEIEKNDIGMITSIRCIEAALIDFGFAKKIEELGVWPIVVGRCAGTKNYLAPEVLPPDDPAHLAQTQFRFSDKTDIYALGKTIQDVISYVFKSLSGKDQSDASIKSISGLHEKLKKLVDSMCADDPQARPDFEKIRTILLYLIWQSKSLIAKNHSTKVNAVVSKTVSTAGGGAAVVVSETVGAAGGGAAACQTSAVGLFSRRHDGAQQTNQVEDRIDGACYHTNNEC